MKEYIKDMVTVFDGVRLDNLHGMNVEIAKELVGFMRSVKSDVLVIGELHCQSTKD